MPMTLERLIKRKEWLSVVGENYNLNDNEKKEINSIIELIKNPCNITTVSYFIKYHLTHYNDRFNSILKNGRSPSKEMCILKYGEIEGVIRYNQWLKNSTLCRSIDQYIDKYEKELGESKFKEVCSKKLMNEESFIKRYGENEGKEKYKKFCERNRGNWTLDRQIELYGSVEGTINYNINKRNVKKTSSLNGYIDKHGEIKGTELWNKRMKVMWKNTSAIGYKERYGENYKSEMYKDKNNCSKESFISRYGEIEGTNRYNEYISKKQA